MTHRRERFGALALALLVAADGARAAAADMSSVATLAKPPLAGAPWTPAEISRLHRAIDVAFATPALRGARVGFYAIDAGDGTVLYDRDGDDDFTPASNAKLLTGSVALARLGPEFRLRTSVLAGAAPQDGTIDGDLVLRGGGDPLLRAADLDAAAAALAAQGVRSVSGRLVWDASYFSSPPLGNGWSWDDEPYDYSARISALSLEDNVVHLKVAPADAGQAAIVTATPLSDAYTLAVDAMTGAAGSKDTIDLRADLDGTIDVVGSIPAGAPPDSIDAAVPDPARYAADVFARALAAHGIAIAGPPVAGTAPADALTLWTHESEPLSTLLADFWYPSDNLVGEQLLRVLGVEAAGSRTCCDAALALERGYLASIGVSPATVNVVDGSGLSRYDQFTPRALVAILRSDWASSLRDIVLDALPVAGVRGSLADAYLAPPIRGRVFAKTGGMFLVTNISGYIATKHHGTVTFSSLIDNALGDDAGIRTARERIFTAIIDG